jgi:hypothetical protein
MQQAGLQSIMTTAGQLQGGDGQTQAPAKQGGGNQTQAPGLNYYQGISNVGLSSAFNQSFVSGIN